MTGFPLQGDSAVPDMAAIAEATTGVFCADNPVSGKLQATQAQQLRGKLAYIYRTSDLDQETPVANAGAFGWRHTSVRMDLGLSHGV